MTLPVVIARLPAGVTAPDNVVLTHEERLVRRRRLVSGGGLAFMVDFPELVALQPDEVLDLSDGTRLRVHAAAEALLAVRGDLPRLAWHIGNRHAPCQIGDGLLLVRHEATMARMLTGLGAQVEPVSAPFCPEGGAYGHDHAG